MEKESKEEILPSGEVSASDTPAEKLEDNGDGIEIDKGSETDTDSDSNSESDSDSGSEIECEVCDKKISGYMNFIQHKKGKKHANAVLRKKKEKKMKKIDTVSENDDELLLQEPFAKCKVCKKDFFDPESYQRHLKCKKHKQKALEASILEQVQEEGKINPDKLRELYGKKRMASDVPEDTAEKITSLSLEDEDEENPEIECKECEKLFTGLIPFTQHLFSKSHAKRVKTKNLLSKVVPGTSKENEIPVESGKSDENTICVEDGVLVCKSCSMSFSGPENALTHVKSKKHAKNLAKYLRKLEKRKEKERLTDTELKSSEKNEEKLETKSPGETAKEKFQPTSDTLDVSDWSDGKVNEDLLAYENYKQYKTIMDSIAEDKVIH